MSMEAKRRLSFHTPEVSIKIQRKLADYQERFKISNRDMAYILMMEVSHYYLKGLTEAN